MKKLNSVIYNKLLLQAEEARDQGMIKLADAIIEAIGPESGNFQEKRAYSSLQEDIHRDLWKIATKLVEFYDLDSVDVLKVESAISSWTSKTIDEIEYTLGIDEEIKSPLELRLPGETE